MVSQSAQIYENAYRYFNTNRIQEAIQECIKAITINPFSPWPYYLIGLCLFMKSKKNEALVYMKRYIDLDQEKFSSTRQRAIKIISQIEREINDKH